MAAEGESAMKMQVRSRHALVVVALAAMTSAVDTPRLSAQTLLIPAGMEAAEQEGASFRHLAGSSESNPRTCALPWINTSSQSGDFKIGGQISPAFPLIAGQRGKIWWAPVHNSKNMPPLLVRGRNLTTMKDTVRFTLTGIAFPIPSSGARVPESERTYFFPSGTTLPTPGRWLVVATSGTNWGCFVLTVSATRHFGL